MSEELERSHPPSRRGYPQFVKGVLSVVPKGTKGVTFYCSLVVPTIFVAAYGGTHGDARQARIIRHTAWGGWLAGWQTGRWLGCW